MFPGFIDLKDFVFIYDGKPIEDVRRAFEKACKRSNIEKDFDFTTYVTLQQHE